MHYLWFIVLICGRMNMKEITAKLRIVARQYEEEFGVQATPDWMLLKLQEELGEMTQDYLNLTGRNRRKPESDDVAKQDLAEEIADVLSFVLLFADAMEIDPEQEVKDKWFAYLK